MSKKVVILGGSGMLGHKMLQTLSSRFHTVGTIRSQNISPVLDSYNLYGGVDVKNFVTVYKALDDLNPDIVINCVGIVKQLPESNNFDISHTINSEFPHKLYTFTNSHGIKLIHISTDCVFRGDRGMYGEGEVPDADDIYGRTKFTGEIVGPNAITLRTSIIGRELNTNHGLLEWFLLNRGKRVQGYTKSIFSGVTTNELSGLVSDIIFNGDRLNGLYNVASDPISKYDLLMIINHYFKNGERVIIERVDGENINRSLNGRKLKLTFGYVPPKWNSMIYEIMRKDKTDYGD
jgi:dTDP-4-dehydrorhamnose reductase